MSRALTDALKAEKNKIHGSNAWLALFKVVISDTVTVRYVNAPNAIVFDGDTYVPRGIVVDQFVESVDGTLTDAVLSIDDVDRIIQAFLQANEVRGRNVTITAVHADHLTAAPDTFIRDKFEIVDWNASDTTVTLTIGHIGITDARFPSTIMTRDTCRWVYKGLECAYSLTLPSCSKHMEGATGCRSHGDDEEADTPGSRQHPERFGGYPGIPPGQVRLG